jgi:hypothetical protein
MVFTSYSTSKVVNHHTNNDIRAVFLTMFCTCSATMAIPSLLLFYQAGVHFLGKQLFKLFPFSAWYDDLLQGFAGKESTLIDFCDGIGYRYAPQG